MGKTVQFRNVVEKLDLAEFRDCRLIHLRKNGRWVGSLW